ncbi:MAG TPA: hypothetical protein VMG30_14915 [Acidobacteriota bacterium]|nr:hypothetical protein [Acidobacteriota bacterium]
MRSNCITATLKIWLLAATVLLIGASVASAQSVNLTAGEMTAVMSDGQTVPMWGYTCGTATGATCTNLNPAAGSNWSPVLITVPSGTPVFAINLTNHLPAPVPTSLVIVGQLGGGLGSTPSRTQSPTHAAQGTTWPVVGPAGGDNPTFTPPSQADRARSFGKEVPNGNTGSLVWNNLQPGTYLIESGTHPSIQGPMGLYGMLVVTNSVSTPKVAYPGVNYDADVNLLFSEIDPVLNAGVNLAVHTSGFSETAVWNGQPGQCGDPTIHSCYPPAVNYDPRYYLINGAGLDSNNLQGSLASAGSAAAGGKVLLRFVNAGLRTHIPAVVGALTDDRSSGSLKVVSGFSLIAEDGNVLPGIARIQNEVLMIAGKAYDVMINTPASGSSALPIFDRALSLSTNNQRSGGTGGMSGFISINGSQPKMASGTAIARNDTYNALITGKTLSVLNPAKGVMANDSNIYGVKVSGVAPAGLVLNADGTFTYTGPPTTFNYCGNSATSGAACATVTLAAATIEAASGITCNIPSPTYTSNVATSLSIKAPGVLAFCQDAAGYPLQVASASPTGFSLSMNSDGSFSATATAGTYTFSFVPQNSQGTNGSPQNVTLVFPSPSGLQVTLIDGTTKAALNPQDYRWIIEEDRTFYVDPNCQQNPLPAGCPTVTPQGGPAIFGTNFHASYMPVVAQGCVGTTSCEAGQTVLDPASGNHVNAICDVGDGVCRQDPSGQKVPLDPSQVHLDPTKHYYLSVLPGDAADPGHAMGGASIAPGQTAINVTVEPQMQHAAKLSVFVFEDDHPLNGEQDAGGGQDILAPNEPGLGGFNITILDLVGGSGDAVGQMTYDEFGQPLSNSLAGTLDPVTHQDACPISAKARTGINVNTGLPDTSPAGITGMIPVCPTYEADGKTLSPLAGQAIVINVPPGRYGVIATPAADRIGRGEEWLQTNTLDGGKDHEAFLRINEPQYFQEYGPASYHVSIGFANPKWINDQGHVLCTGPGAPDCSHTVSGKATGARMSRPSDERLYGSGTRDTFGYTQCYVSLGSPDGADISFAKCDADGNFLLKNIPAGDWRVTIFDQWNDQIVDGISTPVRVTAAGNTDMGEIGIFGWKNNLYTRTFLDLNGDGVSQDNEPGLALVPTNIRYRDGSISNFNSTDLDGYAGFNEVFPIFNWYVMETDSTRYKNTGIHVVNDAGGPVDNSALCGTAGLPPCGDSSLLANMARTHEDFSLPPELRVPGAVYCDHADCPGFSIASRPANGGPGGSTGRIDPPWVDSYGWQSFMGQDQYLEFGKKPFAAGENGGIRGHVVYASTRPFDDPALLLQLSWEPQVPHVTINLYKEGFAADGVTPTLTMVDTTQTSSWDDWAQGFRSDGVPNMNCPGQDPNDPFYYTLRNQPNLLDWYASQHGGPAVTSLPYNSQYKCYDGMHNWNQLQPAPYDGMYRFPSIVGRNPSTGVPAGSGSTNGTPGSLVGTNCTICTVGPDGNPMLPAGKYVVEMVVPPGYELVKEEDKNILIGDAYVAPVVQEFAGFGNIFILPDQASVAAAYNPNNPQNLTTDLGSFTFPRNEGDTGSVETFWPCVGASRIVPDYLSIFPGVQQVSPFAGATRNLCDRKEVTLTDQMSVLAKFYIFTSTHVASHYTGIITDDFTSEFDPFSPAFGEKFSPANLPVSVKDWAGNEISRVYSDPFGIFNGLTYSTWSVNPPDPSGYIPQVMIMCMNDRGGGVTADPLYQSSYSQFCYEWSFMPGQTAYLDTPVIPTAAFAPNYNHPDCDYPNATPAISEVDGDGVGPWVAAAGASHRITIHALGDQVVNNHAYSGPWTSTAPFNAKTITRHYGFGGSQGSGSVTVGGVTASVVSWSDSTIVVTLPTSGTQVPLCSLQQQQQFGGPANAGSGARCGELVVTAANGKKSVDTVMITIGGKAPTRLAAGQTIQSAIDAAAPGDLIIVPPGTYHELLLMWKPVRLQGVGAASTVIDANAHPAGILNPWRLRAVCLFGLSPTGVPEGYDPRCSSSFGDTWKYFNPTASNPQVDRIPFEATVGWDASLNGNLAEQLQEPSLMGAYEGAGITVLSKGVRVPNGVNPWNGPGADEGGFPTGAVLLTNGSRDCGSGTGSGNTRNPFPSNFYCNPSRIDGLSIINSSQGGGGIFVHAWAHNLEISNNRVYNNQGTLAGGISIGQGEHPDAYFAGGADNLPPGSCQSDFGLPTNTQLPYCFNRFVNVHNNSVTLNANEGDELFSSTPSGAGGVAFTTGDDNYQFSNNWVCGNLSTGDGGGVAQLGFVWNGSIQHNTILFNQSTNPTTPSNGGGLMIMSAPDAPFNCPGNNVDPDIDCSHAYSTVGDGIGPNLVINANLIMGNAAEAGAGGGIRFQGVNGLEVSTFPTTPSRWYSVNVTNNIIANNVAGWDGGGVSLSDAIGVNLINNTIISNDSTASSGTLFGAFFAPTASGPTPCPKDAQGALLPCVPLSTPQPAGVSAGGHSTEFLASLPATITCPPGHPLNSANPLNGVTNGACRSVSFPVLYNDVIWQNRAFNIVVTNPAPGSGVQQATVTLVPTLNQASTGQCVTQGANYWDIGLRGDTGPSDHSSGFTFQPKASVLTNIAGYPGGPTGFAANTSSFAPGVVRQYCNGSKIPPEAGAGAWYQVPPGTNEGNVPFPVFSLTAGATVDEGNNWVNISWGPLSLVNPTTEINPSAETTLGDFSLLAGSPAINYITQANSSRTFTAAPLDDFFGNSRKGNLAVDAGAVEFSSGGGGVAAVSFSGPSPALTTVPATRTVKNGTVTVTNTGTAALLFTADPTVVKTAGPTLGFFAIVAPASGTQCVNGGVVAPGGACTIGIRYTPPAVGPNGTATAHVHLADTGAAAATQDSADFNAD